MRMPPSFGVDGSAASCGDSGLATCGALLEEDADNEDRDSEEITASKGHDQIHSPFASGLWLPVVSARLVFPFESCHFRVVRPHACAAVRACWERGLPLLTVVSDIVGCNANGPVNFPVSPGDLGTALDLTSVTEIAELNGMLEVHAVGVRPYRVVDIGARVYRIASGSVDVAPSSMVNVAAVETPGLVRVPGGGDIEPLGQAPPEGWAAFRRRLLWLCRATKLSKHASAASPSDITVSASQDAPADPAEFSWWLAAQLPLPGEALRLLLAVTGVYQRLSICSKVLEPLASTNPVALRAKL